MESYRGEVSPWPYVISLSIPRATKKIINYSLTVDTDFGSISLVFSQTQTVSGLQLRTPNGDWKHVKSVPNGITVNVSM